MTIKHPPPSPPKKPTPVIEPVKPPPPVLPPPPKPEPFFVSASTSDPASVLESRVKDLEDRVKGLETRLETAMKVPDAHEDRLNAIEKHLRGPS